MNAADILKKAAGHMADRAATYDRPEGERSMNATVNAFYAVTGVAMTEEQGWLFMALLKMVRSQQGAFRADSYEDGAAYFALAGEAAHADRNPSEEWQEWPDESRRQEVTGDVQPTIDSGPMWVEWRGASEPPVGETEIVEVRLRNGVVAPGDAGGFEWLHEDSDYDIVAWRTPWPDDDRIDVIGSNGPTGEHYADGWEDAPEWANWRAQNSNGEWNYFEREPEQGQGYWENNGGMGTVRRDGKGYNADWRLTLQKRPI